MDFDDCPPPLPPPVLEEEATQEGAGEEPPMTTLDGTNGDEWILRGLEVARSKANVEKAKEKVVDTAASSTFSPAAAQAVGGGGGGKKSKKKNKKGNNAKSNANSSPNVVANESDSILAFDAPPPLPTPSPDQDEEGEEDIVPATTTTTTTTTAVEVVLDHDLIGRGDASQPFLPHDSPTALVDAPATRENEEKKAVLLDEDDDMTPPPLPSSSDATVYDRRMDATTAEADAIFGQEQPKSGGVAVHTAELIDELAKEAKMQITPAHEVPPALTPNEEQRRREELLLAELDDDEPTIAVRRASLPSAHPYHQDAPVHVEAETATLLEEEIDESKRSAHTDTRTHALHVDPEEKVDIADQKESSAAVFDAVDEALGLGIGLRLESAAAPEEAVDQHAYQGEINLDDDDDDNDPLPPRPSAPVPPSPPPSFAVTSASEVYTVANAEGKPYNLAKGSSEGEGYCVATATNEEAKGQHDDITVDEADADIVLEEQPSPIPATLQNDSITLDDTIKEKDNRDVQIENAADDDIDLESNGEDETAIVQQVQAAEEGLDLEDDSTNASPHLHPGGGADESIVVESGSEVLLQKEIGNATEDARQVDDVVEVKRPQVILSDDDETEQQGEADSVLSPLSTQQQQKADGNDDINLSEDEAEAPLPPPAPASESTFYNYYNQVYTGEALKTTKEINDELDKEEEDHFGANYAAQNADAPVEHEESDIEDDRKYERLPAGDRVVRNSEFEAFATRAVELIQNLQDSKDAEVSGLQETIEKMQEDTAAGLKASVEAVEEKCRSDYMNHIHALHQYLDSKLSDVVERGDKFVLENVEALKQHIAIEIQSTETRVELAMSEQRKKNREKFAVVAEKMSYMQSAIDVMQEALQRAMDLEQFPEPRPIPEGKKIRLQVRLEVARPSPVPIILVPISDKANVADLKHEAIRRARRQGTIGDNVVYSKTAIVFENLTLFDDDDFADIGLDRGDLTVSLVFTGAEAAVQRHYEAAHSNAVGANQQHNAPATVFTSTGLPNTMPPPMPTTASPTSPYSSSSPSLPPPPPPPQMPTMNPAVFPSAPQRPNLNASKDIISGYFLREELAKDINEQETLERRLMGELERMERDPLKNQESLCRIRLAKDIMNRVRSALLDKATYCYQEAHRAAARASLAHISSVMENPTSTVDDFMRASNEAQRVVDGVSSNAGEQGRIDAIEEAAARNQAKKDRMKDDLEELGYELRNKLRVDYEMMPMAERLMDQIDRCSILAASMTLEELDEVHSRVASFIQSIKAKQRM